MNLRAFDALAATSNVPFRTRITGPELCRVFATGEVPRRLWPHVHRALNEAPLEMIDRALAELGGSVDALACLRRIAADVGATERIGHWLRG
jgi:hypothetical protein